MYSFLNCSFINYISYLSSLWTRDRLSLFMVWTHSSTKSHDPISSSSASSHSLSFWRHKSTCEFFYHFLYLHCFLFLVFPSSFLSSSVSSLLISLLFLPSFLLFVFAILVFLLWSLLLPTFLWTSHYLYFFCSPVNSRIVISRP